MHSDAAGVTSVARHSQADLTTACARHGLGPATGPVTRCEHVGMSRTTELAHQLEHVRVWAARKGREVDIPLLMQVLELHVEHNLLAPGDWPAGSVETLLLETWPGRGGVLSDEVLLSATLETYWRCLRATGRLTSGSATPASLVKELRRALPQMAELVPLADPALVAADVRQGAFVQRCLALAAWVGERGREVTATGVLEVAEARAAYQELGLATLDSHVLPERHHQPSLLDANQEQELVQQRPLVGLRSAADLPVLHELWRACLDSGLVMVMGLRAYGADRPPEEDWDWQLLGTDLAVSRLVTQGGNSAAMYLFALWPLVGHEWTGALGAVVRPDGTVSRRDLTKAWWRAPWNTDGMSSLVPARARSDHDFRAAVDVLTDLGVWGRDGDRMTGTEWGRDLVEVLEPLLDLPDPFGGGFPWRQRDEEPYAGF